MACSGCVVVILRRCILIMDVVLIIASHTCMYTQRPPDDEGGGHTMHRDKVPSHMYHKICTHQRDATTLYSLTIDRVQARIQDLREEGLSQILRLMQRVVN